MSNHERFQVHCRFCFLPFEADSVGEAQRKVEEHEQEKHPVRVRMLADGKPKPRMEDFY